MSAGLRRKEFIMKKKIVAIILTLVCLSSMVIGAVAASNSQTISALLSFDTKITFNGETQVFKNANGDVVYPINYQGTNYLPVRAVAELLGVAVDWDGATRTVILGERDKTLISDKIWKTDSSLFLDVKTTSNSNELTFNGETYNYGVAVAVAEFCRGLISQAGYLQLDGKYTTLHVKAISNNKESSTLRFLDKDETVLQEISLGDGVMKDVEINVAGLEKVFIHYGGDNYTNAMITDMYLK